MFIQHHTSFLRPVFCFWLHFYYLVGSCIYSLLYYWMCVIWLSTGDLFDMLLPMLSIYQEYVRNHHYSLQLLTECKQNPSFTALLARLENKPTCQGRSLETFLTYPMHQVLWTTVLFHLSAAIILLINPKLLYNSLLFSLVWLDIFYPILVSSAVTFRTYLMSFSASRMAWVWDCLE